MSLLVYDKKLNTMVEYYTDRHVQLDQVYEQMQIAQDVKKRTRINKIIKIRSVNANEKIKLMQTKGEATEQNQCKHSKIKKEEHTFSEIQEEYKEINVNGS